MEILHIQQQSSVQDSHLKQSQQQAQEQIAQTQTQTQTQIQIQQVLQEQLTIIQQVATGDFSPMACGAAAILAGVALVVFARKREA